MEPVPLILKQKFFPNIDTTPLLRELFQNEFQVGVPNQKLSRNICTSFQYETENEEERNEDGDLLENFIKKRNRIRGFAATILEAYQSYEKNENDIRKAENNIFEIHTSYLEREFSVLEDKRLQDLLILKRFPLFQALNKNYVQKYKLLEGDAGFPPRFAAVSDFRLINFKTWRKNLDTLHQDVLILNCEENKLPAIKDKKPPIKAAKHDYKKIRNPRPKRKGIKKKEMNIFEAEPNSVFFTDFTLGEVYKANITVKNVHHKVVQFAIKPMRCSGPFKVMLKEKTSLKLLPGLSFQISVEFKPKSLDNAVEEVVIVAEDGNRLLIPIVAYLEPPVLKTHRELNEFTRITMEKIASSHIECGECFTGDSKVTKIRFRSFGGPGEFFIMNSDNWSRNCINSVTVDNLLEIPPFRVYPVFFKIQKDEVIDLFVEFLPKTSGTHVEKIVIACDNGEHCSLDLLGDAVGWHSYYFTFQSTLLKEFPVHQEEDIKVKYYLDFEDTEPNGKVERLLYVSNNSSMSFDFQWKIREANISLNGDEFLKIPKYQVKIDPESGTFDPSSVWEFLVTINLNNADIGSYRMVLSLFVLNLPCQCIEEDNTIIQPTGLVRNLYSQSLYGEEECTPELLSLQGTYETLQESIKTYVECQNKAQTVSKNDFCRTTCLLNPGLCAKPLKKSKTFFNIGESIDEESFGCACRCRPRPAETESLSEYCQSEKFQESSSPLKNEVTWDFVDILVDEIELWVEVLSPRVTLEPNVVVFPSCSGLNKIPTIKQVKLINHNISSVTCSWIRLKKKKARDKHQDENLNKEAKVISPERKIRRNRSGTANEFSEYVSYESESDAGTSKGEEAKEIAEPYVIVIEPAENFTLSGLSELTCTIGLSAHRTGKIEETVLLSVNNGHLEIELLILGNAVVKHFDICPQILDFGALRQDGKHSKHFQITNKSSGALLWQIKQFQYDNGEEQFIDFAEKRLGNLKKASGIIEKEGGFTQETYSFDTRTDGIKCSILEIEARKMEQSNSTKKYLLALAEVKAPEVWLSAPRFEDAILSLPGKMYVGQKISSKVILTNLGIVSTNFTWGHSFGCHCRKLKIEISPKIGVIDNCKKSMVRIDVTALDEGIISHCYVPCFFCRSKEPLILSVVGIAEKLNVTFEIIDYPKQTHMSTQNFLRSPFYHTVLRIPWPVKAYNPTLNLNYLPEELTKNMICLCAEVEEEANRAFPDLRHGSESIESVKNLISEDKISEEQIGKAKSSSIKSSKVQLDENSKADVIEKKKSEENSVVLYSSRGSISEFSQCLKPEIDFSDVPYRTPVVRQFVIRNETPIPATFKIRVLNYGLCPNLPNNRLERIKRKVFGEKDEYGDKLGKNQPLVLIVEPSEGNLDKIDAVGINVTAYGNTWGEYRDCLLCEIKGIEAYYMKLLIRIVGHPITFPGICCQPSFKPILRFEPRKWINEPVSKEIKVVNRSAVPLTMSWIVFLNEPLPQEEGEGSCNSAEIQANFESTLSGVESTKSSKNYLPKNASDSGLPFRNMLEARELSESGTFESFAKTESPSEMKDKAETINEEKICTAPTLTEEEKSQVQQLPFPGRLDNKTFQVEPKETFFEPFEEKKITISFNPGACHTSCKTQVFKGVLTGCVRLKPEHEKCSGIYYRPCGSHFVSELLDFSAFVETPLLTFEVLKADIKFMMDSNVVIASPSRMQTVSRRFLIKNNNQNSVSVKIETVPGVIFKVSSVQTLDKFYPEYNPDLHPLDIGSKQSVEVELTCTVTYKDVMYAYEKLTHKKRKLSHGSVSERLTGKCTSEKESSKTEKEPWYQYFGYVAEERVNSVKFAIGPKDSLELHLNRMSSKSDNSICFSNNERFSEAEGEFYQLWEEDEVVPKKEVLHKTVIQEDLNFVQARLITQTLAPELHLSFPAIKLSVKNFDFGNVYMGDSATRYCSLINLTGFPIEFRIKAKFNNGDFTVRPVTGNLPPSNYNSDIGVTITIEFRPSEPYLSKQTFHVFCNQEMEFDFHELYVAGFGSWNEKHRQIKFETYTKLKSICPN